MSNVSRGYRNNNPGNLIKSSVKYTGEVESKDERFRAFQSMEYGYRAIFKLLQYYIGKGINTITLMIDTYAPSHENDTVSYIKYVAQRAGIRPDLEVQKSDLDTLERIVTAISKVENGVEPDINQIKEGRKLLGLSTSVKVASGSVGLVALAVLLYALSR